ncbi:hypothetical protein NOVOSPHI9U_540002 [Novosphingobium sp. 9U]|nr:hypothetical protein NOVOSPHI9U_540002 [Novosphingobium sp. 9U]
MADRAATRAPLVLSDETTRTPFPAEVCKTWQSGRASAPDRRLSQEQLIHAMVPLWRTLVGARRRCHAVWLRNTPDRLRGYMRNCFARG